MVSNLDMKRLNSAIGEAIADSVNVAGYAIHADIKAKVVSENADVLARISADLADAQVGKMITSHLRSWTKIKLTGARQLSLPGVPATVLEDMPVLITVPADDADLEDENIADQPTTKHISLDRASVGELRRYWRFIEAHLKAVEKTFNATGFIVRKVEGIDDEVPLLKALRTKRGNAAA